MSDVKSEKSSPGLTTEPEMKGKKKLFQFFMEIDNFFLICWNFSYKKKKNKCLFICFL